MKNIEKKIWLDNNSFRMDLFYKSKNGVSEILFDIITERVRINESLITDDLWLPIAKKLIYENTTNRSHK